MISLLKFLINFNHTLKQYNNITQPFFFFFNLPYFRLHHLPRHITSSRKIPSTMPLFLYTFTPPIRFFSARKRSSWSDSNEGRGTGGLISSWLAWVSLQAHIIRVFVRERTFSARFTASQTPASAIFFLFSSRAAIDTHSRGKSLSENTGSRLFFFNFSSSPHPPFPHFPRLIGTIDLVD